jgi:hypothetical protein
MGKLFPGVHVKESAFVKFLAVRWGTVKCDFVAVFEKHPLLDSQT